VGKEAQFVESRDFQVVEAARILNIPPHKLKHKMGERPGANLTESEQDYLNNTLDPWLVKIEQEANRKLVPRSQRLTWYIEHDRNAYLRMTPQQRAESYKAYHDMGVLSAKQIAKKENLPEPEEPPTPEPPATPPPPMDQPARMLTALRALVVEAVSRYLKRESNAAQRAAKKGPESFGAWVREFYGGEVDVLRGYLVPAVGMHLAQRGLEEDATRVARDLAAEYVERSREDLLELRAGDLPEQVERLTELWEMRRPVEMADRVAAYGGSDAA
jgi:hypothetical protein